MLYRTTMVLDEELVQTAMGLGDFKTKSEMIDVALKGFIVRRNPRYGQVEKFKKNNGLLVDN